MAFWSFHSWKREQPILRDGLLYSNGCGDIAVRAREESTCRRQLPQPFLYIAGGLEGAVNDWGVTMLVWN